MSERNISTDWDNIIGTEKFNFVYPIDQILCYWQYQECYLVQYTSILRCAKSPVVLGFCGPANLQIKK